eukprot:4789317-Prymnesium_polylepis.5
MSPGACNIGIDKRDQASAIRRFGLHGRRALQYATVPPTCTEQDVATARMRTDTHGRRRTRTRERAVPKHESKEFGGDFGCLLATYLTSRTCGRRRLWIASAAARAAMWGDEPRAAGCGGACLLGLVCRDARVPPRRQRHQRSSPKGAEGEDVSLRPAVRKGLARVDGGSGALAATSSREQHKEGAEGTQEVWASRGWDDCSARGAGTCPVSHDETPKVRPRSWFGSRP